MINPCPKPPKKVKQRKGLSVKTAIRAMSKSPSARACKIADALWAIAVKLEAKGRCQVPNCGGPAQDSHHVVTRSVRHLRHDVHENGIALCFNHHVGQLYSAHKKPAWFEGVLIKLMGQTRYDALQLRSERYEKPDYQSRIIELKQIINELEGKQ